jgi:hypothetical protein
MAWVEALNHNRVWDEDRDRPRFQAAFRLIAATSRQWPTPQSFVESLPAHEPQQALPHPVCSPEQAKANIERIQRMLRGEDDGDDYITKADATF